MSIIEKESLLHNANHSHKKKGRVRGQGRVFLEICQNLSIFLPELSSILLAQKFLHEMTPFRLFQRSLCALERTLLSQ